MKIYRIGNNRNDSRRKKKKCSLSEGFIFTTGISNFRIGEFRRAMCTANSFMASHNGRCCSFRLVAPGRSRRNMCYYYYYYRYHKPMSAVLGLNIILKRKRVHVIIGLIYERFFPVLRPAPTGPRAYTVRLSDKAYLTPRRTHGSRCVRSSGRIAYNIIIIM